MLGILPARYFGDEYNKMTVKINGDKKELEDGITLKECLERLGIKAGLAATEVNQQIVKREERDKCVLQNGDVVEIVHIIGGG